MMNIVLKPHEITKSVFFSYEAIYYEKNTQLTWGKQLFG
jgi:hypothetical protein